MVSPARSVCLFHCPHLSVSFDSVVVLPLESMGTIHLIPALTAFDISEDQFHACPESNYLIKSQVLQLHFVDLWSFLWLCWELWGLGSGCWFLADKHLLIAGRRFGNWCWSCSLWTHVKGSCWEHPSPKHPWWGINKQWNEMGDLRHVVVLSFANID